MRGATTLGGAAAALLALAVLGGCSTYNGQITNAPAPAGGQGPPMLTGGFAP